MCYIGSPVSDDEVMNYIISYDVETEGGGIVEPNYLVVPTTFVGKSHLLRLDDGFRCCDKLNKSFVLLVDTAEGSFSVIDKVSYENGDIDRRASGFNYCMFCGGKYTIKNFTANVWPQLGTIHY